MKAWTSDLRWGFSNEEIKFASVLPELVDVFGGLGKVVGEVDFGFAQFAQLVDRELKAVFLYLLMRPLILRKSSCLEKLRELRRRCPTLLASSWPLAVAEGEREVSSPDFLGLICLPTTTKVEVMTLSLAARNRRCKSLSSACLSVKDASQRRIRGCRASSFSSFRVSWRRILWPRRLGSA